MLYKIHIYEMHIFIQLIIIVFEPWLNHMQLELQIKITSWAIVSLAGGGLGKVEKRKHQGEKEKNHPSHLQQADLRCIRVGEKAHLAVFKKQNIITKLACQT